ncbi:flavodoxin [Levilactobacillus namurensis]|uniref:Flavodoxin-like domain-containing protein n=1 Tax=Levilactobacillus namurensis TaxID=380393 RepID=A0AAW8W8S6_9LACO|nr:hypothetical protein [Levilactobacillus namurensis]MDT7014885.1 hypothetical protein [Levilactobacillus namurensis]
MAVILVFSSPGETLLRGRPVPVTVGNTQRVATLIGQRLNLKPQAIVPQVPYPRNYAALLARARQEQADQALPALEPLAPALLADPVWFLGYPVWFGDLPRPVVSLLDRAQPKVVLPFATHEGSGFGQSLTTLHQRLPTAQIYPGLPIRGSRVDRAACAVDHWLQQYSTSSLIKRRLTDDSSR